MTKEEILEQVILKIYKFNKNEYLLKIKYLNDDNEPSHWTRICDRNVYSWETSLSEVSQTFPLRSKAWDFNIHKSDNGELKVFRITHSKIYQYVIETFEMRNK